MRRVLTVSKMDNKPYIRLLGNWVEEFFASGEKIEVINDGDNLVLQKHAESKTGYKMSMRLGRDSTALAIIQKCQYAGCGKDASKRHIHFDNVMVAMRLCVKHLYDFMRGHFGERR